SSRRSGNPGSGSKCASGRWVRGPSGRRVCRRPCCGRGVHKDRRAWPPLFFGLLDLLLQSGGEAVAEELSSVFQEQCLAIGQGFSENGLVGLGFEFGGEFQGHLYDLLL